MEIVDLAAIDGRGPAWGTASEELNATLLVWRPGEGQPEHVNAERDVALVVLEGAGLLVVDGEEHTLTAGALAIVPRGARRSIVAGAEGLRCLTVHRRRGGLGVTDFENRSRRRARRKTHDTGVRVKSDTHAPHTTAQDATASSTASGMSKFA